MHCGSIVFFKQRRCVWRKVAITRRARRLR
jgi:hypothetical protein